MIPINPGSLTGTWQLKHVCNRVSVVPSNKYPECNRSHASRSWKIERNFRGIESNRWRVGKDKTRSAVKIALSKRVTSASGPAYGYIEFYYAR